MRGGRGELPEISRGHPSVILWIITNVVSSRESLGLSPLFRDRSPLIFFRLRTPSCVEMIIPFIKRFGKAAIAIELSAAAGLYYIFHEINTGGPETRKKWDDRLPGLIDAFHKVTGDDRVIEHRRNHSCNSKSSSTE